MFDEWWIITNSQNKWLKTQNRYKPYSVRITGKMLAIGMIIWLRYINKKYCYIIFGYTEYYLYIINILCYKYNSIVIYTKYLYISFIYQHSSDRLTVTYSWFSLQSGNLWAKNRVNHAPKIALKTPCNCFQFVRPLKGC